MWNGISIWLFIIFNVFGIFSNVESSLTPPSEPLNVILIMTDDQGYGDLGCHGNEMIQTPNLDQLRQESVTFTNFHVGTTCTPTRAGLMSGLHCNRVGAWHTVNGRSFLSERFPTIADYFNSNGYKTGIFGKWHLGDNYPYRPQDRGFDESVVHGGGGVGQTPDLWNNDYFDDTYLHNGQPEQYEGFCTDIWFEEAIGFIKNSRNNQEPFFCYLSTNAPHGPHHVPESYIDPYRDNEEVVSPNFYGQITNIDDNYGKLVDSLTALGLWENTILVFLTDNGTASGVKLNKQGHVVKGYNAGMRGKKGSEYEGGHRVPLFMKFPGKMEIPKSAFSTLASYMDIVPTLLDFTGLEVKDETRFDGISLKSLITKGNQENLKDRILITDTQRNEFPKKWKNTSVMQNDWRLVNNKELYNIKEDPGQQQNVIDQHPAIAQSLEKGYEKWWQDLQADLEYDNRIIIGNPRENPSLITCHDWHANQDPPWHQKHIREGKARNGYWLLDVAQTGTYRIRIYRWPPSLGEKAGDHVERGQPVSGGEAYSVGMGIHFTKAKISIQDNTLETKEEVDGSYFEFALTLKKGPAQMQTWLWDDDEVERGGYYIEIFRLDGPYFQAGHDPKPSTKNWAPNPIYTDEFNGNALDANKWTDYHPFWVGRPPGLFKGEAIKVQDGSLQITNYLLPQIEYVKGDTFTIGCGAVVSKTMEAHYGYYECRMKASELSMSSTFWLKNRPTTDSCVKKQTELDIIECIGGAKENPNFATTMHSNTHFIHYDCAGNRDSKSRGNNAPVGGRVADGFHVYGAWWKNANEILFFIDGKYQYTVNPVTLYDPTPFDRPMFLHMVTETYHWQTPPTEQEFETLNRTTQYDWVRAWTLQDND